MSTAVCIVNGLSDSYKSDRISQMVTEGTRFSHEDVLLMLNNASDSYKKNMIASCKGGVGYIPQDSFVKICSNMCDSYKTEFARECMPLIYWDPIPASTLKSCLSNMDDSYKVAFAQILIPQMSVITNLDLIAMLGKMGDSYKSAFITTCLSQISQLNGNDIYIILFSCSDSYKTKIITAIGDKLVLSSYNDKIFFILENTAESYKTDLKDLLSKRILKKHVALKKSIIKKDHSMSDAMLGFMQESVTMAIQATLKNVNVPKEKQQEQKSENNLSLNECVICCDAAAEWVIVPCGHKVICKSCGAKITHCPICRGLKEKVIKVYEQ